MMRIKLFGAPEETKTKSLEEKNLLKRIYLKRKYRLEV